MHQGSILSSPHTVCYVLQQLNYGLIKRNLVVFKLEHIHTVVFVLCCNDPTLRPHSQGQQVNEAACDLAREVANEGDALVAGGVSQTPSYLSCKSETEVKAIFKKQMDVFLKKNVDFLIAEVRWSFQYWSYCRSYISVVHL